MPRLSADARHRIRFKLNGRTVEADAEPRMLLTDFLRHNLAMTGTHVGCEHGVCGACTVEIDGVPARACLTLAVQADGSDIRTIEGLAPAPGRYCRTPGGFERLSHLAQRDRHLCLPVPAQKQISALYPSRRRLECTFPGWVDPVD